MSVLVTGGHGQLGSALSKVLPSAMFVGSKELDITDLMALNTFIKNNDVKTIVNCAAYTAVDDAEDNFFKAKKVNVEGPRNLAYFGLPMIHISTDYVFDGLATIPYKETDKPNPKSIYGLTKLFGENDVLRNNNQAIIIRTSWLFSNYGKNFFKTMQRLGAERESINVVNDQIGTPTYAADLSRAIVQIIPQINTKNAGIYNFSNEGQCSWYDFASLIMDLSKYNCVVNPISTSEYPTKAARPKYSVLDKTKIKNTFGIDIPSWQDALIRCIRSNEKNR